MMNQFMQYDAQPIKQNTQIPSYLTQSHFEKIVMQSQQSQQIDKEYVKRIQSEILNSLDQLFGSSIHCQRLENYNKNFLEFQCNKLYELPKLQYDQFSQPFQEVIKQTNSQNEDQQSGKGTTQSNSQQTQQISQTYRQQAIQRYKLKKYRAIASVSYQCRKVVADSRPRMKGRFISKVELKEIQNLIDGIISNTKLYIYNLIIHNLINFQMIRKILTLKQLYKKLNFMEIKILTVNQQIENLFKIFQNKK